MQAELKPCPFCESGDVMTNHAAGKVFVMCVGCHASSSCHADEMEARRKWNARPIPTPADLEKWEALRVAAEDMLDPEPCRLDHHGYCQEHGWLQDGECPQSRLKKALVGFSPKGQDNGA